MSIGLGGVTIDENSEVWSLATVMIEYSGGGTPGFANIQFLLMDGSGGDPPSTDAFFIIDDVELDLTTDVNEDNSIVPDQPHLYNNYPNPFNPSTTIKYALPEASHVTLKIFNTLGEEVSVLVNRVMDAGTHRINFEASQLNSGIYFYQLITADFVESKKMMLMK